MSYLPVLYGVFSANYRGSIPMSIATPSDILERIRLCRSFSDKLKYALNNPIPNQNGREFIETLLEHSNEEIDELFDYYVAKLKSVKCFTEVSNDEQQR